MKNMSSLEYAVGFARDRLQRNGSVHESDIATAFRQSIAKYRSTEAMPDDRIRDFIRNWNPTSQRTPNGFFKVQPQPHQYSNAQLLICLACCGHSCGIEDSAPRAKQQMLITMADHSCISNSAA